MTEQNVHIITTIYKDIDTLLSSKCYMHTTRHSNNDLLYAIYHSNSPISNEILNTKILDIHGLYEFIKRRAWISDIERMALKLAKDNVTLGFLHNCRHTYISEVLDEFSGFRKFIKNKLQTELKVLSENLRNGNTINIIINTDPSSVYIRDDGEYTISRHWHSPKGFTPVNVPAILTYNDTGISLSKFVSNIKTKLFEIIDKYEVIVLHPSYPYDSKLVRPLRTLYSVYKVEATLVPYKDKDCEHILNLLNSDIKETFQCTKA